MSCAREEQKEKNPARCSLKYNLPLSQTSENKPLVQYYLQYKDLEKKH